MFVLVIFHVKTSEIEIMDTNHIHLESAFFSPKFWAKVLRVLGILLVKNDKIELK
jgi:hypothetical protein